MSAIGPFGHSRLGPESDKFYLVVNSAGTNPMTLLDAGWAARFMAMDSRDIASVCLNFSAITSPGQVEVRIETVSSSKPSGTLYDANATVTITPSVGWNVCTFATLPTTGLTPGTEYCIVAITTTAGTTMTMRSHVAQAVSAQTPCVALTTTGASMRSNFAESSSSVPVCTIVYEDGVEEDWGFCSAPVGTTNDVYSTRAFGGLLTVPTGVTLKVVGVAPIIYTFSGTPDNLRCRIYDSGFNLVTSATCTVNKSSIANTNRRLVLRFPEISLTAGTYTIVLDQVNHSTTSANRYIFYSITPRSAALVPSGMTLRTTLNIDGGPPPTWVDDTASLPGIELVLNNIISAGGGGSSVRNPGIKTGGRL